MRQSRQIKKTTYDLLIDKYNTRYVPLIEIGSYIGITDENKLRRKAKKNDLGDFRAFQFTKSQKAPWFVDLENVAQVLDRHSQEINGTDKSVRIESA